jgi:hypothetical protein
MGCLGGTVEDPRDWVRVFGLGEYREGRGRVCRRRAPWTSHWVCSSCRLFRGKTHWGGQSTGLFGDEPHTLTRDEVREWEAAMEAAFDDDFEPIGRWLAKMRGEAYGVDHLRRIGEPEAMAARAAAVRIQRQADPGLRHREAEARRAYRLAHAEHEKEQARLRKRRQRDREKSRRGTPPFEEAMSERNEISPEGRE